MDIYATETDITYEVNALASDNLARKNIGNEVSGYLYGISAGLRFSERDGPDGYVIGGTGGRQQVVDDDRTTTNTYRLYADFNKNFEQGNFLHAEGYTSQKVEVLEYSDLDQRRSLVNRTHIGIELGKKMKSGSKWLGAISGKRLGQQGEVTLSRLIKGSADLIVSRKTNFHVNASLKRGDEQVSQNEWLENELTVGVSRRPSRKLRLSSQLGWFHSESYIYPIDLLSDWDHLRLTVYQESLLSRGTKLDASVGYEGVRASETDWDWGETFSLFLSAPLIHKVTDLGKVAVVNTGVSHKVGVSYLNEGIAILNHTNLFDVNVTWRPGRRTELNTGFRLTQKIYPEFQNQPNVEEVQSEASKNFLWVMTKKTKLRLEALADRRESNRDIRNLEENRIGIEVAGYF